MRKFDYLCATIRGLAVFLILVALLMFIPHGVSIGEIAGGVIAGVILIILRQFGISVQFPVLEAVLSSLQSDSEYAKRRSFVADLLLPIKLSSDLHANLDEVEPLWIAAHGMTRARWIRRSQEFQAIAKYWASPVRQAFQAVLKVIR